MSNIYRVDSRTDIPDIGRAVNPVLDIPNMDFKSIASALDSYSTEEENRIANAEKNFNTLVELNDALTGEKFDNHKQAEIYNKAKKEAGLDDNSFRVNIDELRDPYKVRSLSSKVSQIYNRSDIKNIIHEQQRGKDYLDMIFKIKDINPNLYKKALSRYNNYREGEISGFDLLPQEFTPIDVDKTITDAIKLVPQIETSDIEGKEGLVYEKLRKQRSKDVISTVIKQLESNAIFKNNIEAKFTDENGHFDRKSYDNYVNNLAEEYAKEHTKIQNVRQVKGEKPAKESRLDRLVSSIEKMGGDSNIIGKKIGELEFLIEDSKNKSLTKIEETGAEVRVYYKDLESGEERFISIPKTEASILENPPVGYNVETESGVITISDEDLQSFNDSGDIIEDLDFWGKSHTAPIEGAESNVGEKAFAKVEDGVLITNDIQFLRNNGLVDPETDYDELGDLGWEYELLPNKTTVVKKSVKPNKKVVNISNYEVPDKDKLIDKLSKNPIISQYDRDSEEFKLALLFLSSPEIQDGFFRDVYMAEGYPKVLNALYEVAPLVDGKIDTKNVHESVRPLLKENGEEKIRYLAHHHGYKGVEFLTKGVSNIKGNENADKEMKSQWNRLDKALKKYPNMSFDDIIDMLESGGKYDEVYTGSARSSAIGKHQILFKTHYGKIRKYIYENFDDLVKAEIKPANKGNSKSNDKLPFFFMNYIEENIFEEDLKPQNKENTKSATVVDGTPSITEMPEERIDIKPLNDEDNIETDSTRSVKDFIFNLPKELSDKVGNDPKNMNFDKISEWILKNEDKSPVKFTEYLIEELEGLKHNEKIKTISSWLKTEAMKRGSSWGHDTKEFEG